ncbi:hypothetical protein [Burkholderia vietnamiensis]|uniref:hypothetical protein n=1 Tax=Burkholderia vietnamiensis TaxID=60552 RepID=UPI000B0B68F7|nr:hypothetical protein [Burkholderia vietnamiensis]
MPTNQNQTDPRFVAGAVVLFVAAGLVMMFLSWVATLIGASFMSVLRTFSLWIGFAVPAIAAGFFLRSRYWTIAVAYACCAWPAAWGVLDSIAADGREGDSGPIDFSQYSTSIVNSGWVKWGVLLALVAALVFAFYRERDD